MTGPQAESGVHVIQELVREFRPGEKELLSVTSDLSLAGSFAMTAVVVTNERVLIAPSEGGSAMDIPLGDISSVTAVPLVGGGQLEIRCQGEALVRVPYSNSLASPFATLASGIEQLRRGEPLTVRIDIERNRCEKCGRLLPEKDGVCPHCIRRWVTFLRICQYLRPYTGGVFLLIGASLIMSFSSLLPPIVTQWIVDRVLLPEVGKTMALDARASLLALYVGLLALLRLIAWGAEWIHGYAAAWLGSRITADIRSQLYQQLEMLSLRFFDKHEVGSLVARISNDSGALQDFLIRGLPYSVVNACTFAGIFIVMFLLNWRLALCVALPVPAVALWGFVFWRRMSELFHQWWRAGSDFSAKLGESLWGIRVIKAFRLEEYEIGRFEKQNEALFRANVRTGRQRAFLLAAMGLVTTFGIVTLWLLSSAEVIQGRMTPGELLAFYGYLLLFYGPLQWFGQVSNWMTQAFTAAQRIFEVLDNATEARQPSGTKRLPCVRGHVAFRQVTFGYDSARPVLRGTELDVAPGEYIGIVGRSGEGKTTMMNLLCRFYDVDQGVIEVDGLDIRQIRLGDLRSKIGVVLQEPFLFSGTVAENISYGKPGAGLEDVIAAAKVANAHEFIVNLPEGYDTRVGERGGRLSGGEKQRIAIARAILANPTILILDEATSSVDPISEKLIQEAIDRLAAERTTFVIAHRLSTLRKADRLVVIEEGRIVEQGTFAELLERGGSFSRLIRLQDGAAENIIEA
jgi:ATP-binding cassette subfamily B protein